MRSAHLCYENTLRIETRIQTIFIYFINAQILLSLMDALLNLGKTLLARAIAGEAKVPFFFASGSGTVSHNNEDCIDNSYYDNYQCCFHLTLFHITTIIVTIINNASKYSFK
jgi:hypothetical protein